MRKLLPTLLLLVLTAPAHSQVASLNANGEKPAGLTFSVSAVEPARTMLPVFSVEKALKLAIGKEPQFIPHEHQNTLLYFAGGNGLVATVQECYDAHRPLIISPDAIWLTICQGVSTHVNLHFDSLQHLIFKKGKPDQLVVRNDSLEHSPAAWASLMDELSKQAANYTIGNSYAFFVPSFTTTTPTIRTTYQVTLLESTQKAFKYVGESGCGIPSITLTGSKRDWVDMLKRLDMLDKLGLASWAKELRPVIGEFVSVFDGKVNGEFWEAMYKSYTDYNEFYLSGWILKLFPYIKTWESEEGILVPQEKVRPNGSNSFDVPMIPFPEETIAQAEYTPSTDSIAMKELADDTDSENEKGMFYYEQMMEVLIPNPYLSGSDHLMSTLSTDNIPSGMAKVDVLWNNYFNNTQTEMEVYAGFLAVRQYNDKSLEPLISWAVCRKDSPPIDRRSSEYYELEDEVWDAKFQLRDTVPTNHSAGNSWCPLIFTNPDIPAVYNSKRFETHEASVEFITNYLQNALRQSAEYKDVKSTNLQVEITILSNGKIGKVQVVDNANPKLQVFIAQQLAQLPEPWMPALSVVTTMLDEIDVPKQKIRVNSMVTLTMFKE